MSQKNKHINPLPPSGKSSKKGNKKKMEELSEFIDNNSHLYKDPVNEVPSKLKRLVNSKRKKENEKFILEPEYSEEEEEEYDVSGGENESESEFSRYGLADDQDIEKLRAGLGNNPKNKREEKNEASNSEKHGLVDRDENKKPKSVKKEKKPTTQTNLLEMFKMAQRKETVYVRKEEEKFSDDSMDEISMRRRRREAENANAGLSEKDAFKLAMQQSLEEEELRAHQPKVEYNSLDNYQYDNINKSKKENFSDQPKYQETKKEVKKETKTKSASKKNVSEKKENRTGPMAGMHIIFTGEFENYTKSQITELVINLGAETHSSIVKKATHLLQGSYCVNNFGKKTDQDVRTTGKSTEAAQKGVKIISFDNLESFFLETTEKTLTEWMERGQPKQDLLDRFSSINKTSPKKTEYGTIDEEGDKKRIIADGISIPWTEKYKPMSSEEIIAQKSQIKQLKEWLEAWEDIHIHGNKREVKANFNSMVPAGNINSNAALLSGDAGLGKTTTARLIAAEYGYSIVEYNASDARNKKSVELISVGKNNMSLMGNRTEKTLIIMDEVDGMSSGDRGGITAIIDMIKKTKVPIICICNDRQAQKIKSLAGHCHDIKFHKPDKREIAKRLQAIITAEGGQATSTSLEIIVDLLQNDVRQILQYLELIFKTGTTNITADIIEKRCGKTKDSSLLLNFFEGAKMLMCRTIFKGMTISQRVDTAFIDSDFVPLLVQENYLSACAKKKLNRKEFHQISLAAEGFVKADLYDRMIMKNQDYSIMPNKMFMGSVYPTEMACESIGFPKFTQWLGKFSSERKNKRLIKELKYTLACVSSVTSSSVKHIYAPMLYERICRELKMEDANTEAIVEFMLHYGITPSILTENLVGLQYGEKVNLFKNIEGPKKAKLTKTYNKMCEATKFKKDKMKIAPVEHIKYDDILGEVGDDNEEGNSENEDENSEKVEVVAAKKSTKGANKKKK